MEVDQDREAGTWRLKAQADDRRIGGGVASTVETVISEQAPGQTQMRVGADVQFSGRLGQLGQPLIKKKADDMVQEFAEGLKRAVSGVGAGLVAALILFALDNPRVYANLRSRQSPWRLDMKREFTASVTQEGAWYVAQALEVDVASQGESVEEALENLREALTPLFRTSNRSSHASHRAYRGRYCRRLVRFPIGRWCVDFWRQASVKLVRGAATSSL